MKKYLKYISFLGIALAVISSLLVFNKTIVTNTHFVLLTVGMALWYTTAPFWKKNKSLADEDEK